MELKNSRKVLNIKDPTNPFLIASYDSPGVGMEILVRDNSIYVADNYSIHILRTNFSDYSGPIWHVSTDGSDYSGDGSVSNPFGTIQYALNWADIGDTVQVENGTYTEESRITMRSGVCLRSESGMADSVLIQAGGYWDIAFSCTLILKHHILIKGIRRPEQRG